MARAEVTRGEIWLVDLGMAQKVRPAVVLSVAYLDHERALISEDSGRNKNRSKWLVERKMKTW